MHNTCAETLRLSPAALASGRRPHLPVGPGGPVGAAGGRGRGGRHDQRHHAARLRRRGQQPRRERRRAEVPIPRARRVQPCAGARGSMRRGRPACWEGCTHCRQPPQPNIRPGCLRAWRKQVQGRLTEHTRPQSATITLSWSVIRYDNSILQSAVNRNDVIAGTRARMAEAGGAVDVLVDGPDDQRRQHGEHHVEQGHVKVCARAATHGHRGSIAAAKSASSRQLAAVDSKHVRDVRLQLYVVLQEIPDMCLHTPIHAANVPTTGTAARMHVGTVKAPLH